MAETGLRLIWSAVVRLTIVQCTRRMPVSSSTSSKPRSTTESNE